jgi:hypothetical protein
MKINHVSSLALVSSALFAPLAMAHSSETASSIQATIAHQLAAPEHLLPVVALLGVLAYGPSLLRKVRGKNKGE